MFIKIENIDGYRFVINLSHIIRIREEVEFEKIENSEKLKPKITQYHIDFIDKKSLTISKETFHQMEQVLQARKMNVY